MYAVAVSNLCLLNLLFNNFVTEVIHNYVLNLEKKTLIGDLDDGKLQNISIF